jgi:hypothetical protein
LKSAKKFLMSSKKVWKFLIVKMAKMLRKYEKLANMPNNFEKFEKSALNILEIQNKLKIWRKILKICPINFGTFENVQKKFEHFSKN